MNDENGMPQDLDVHLSVETNEKGEETILVRMDGGVGMDITLTHSTPSDRSRKAWRGIRTFGLFLALIYMLEEEYCSGTGSSTARSCDRFPFTLLIFFSCLGDSLAEWFCVLFLLVTLRTLLVTAKVEYIHYRAEQKAQRTSFWDNFVKYGYQHHVFDNNEETIVHRTTRIANQITQEIWRSARKNTFVLVLRTLPFLAVFRFVLVLLFCMLGTLLGFMGIILFGVLVFMGIILFGVLGTLLAFMGIILFGALAFMGIILFGALVFMGIILFGAFVAFVAFMVGVLGIAIRGMLGVFLLITIRLLLQFQFFVKPTISLVYKILHF
jgi:hypothetical protein